MDRACIEGAGEYEHLPWQEYTEELYEKDLNDPDTNEWSFLLLDYSAWLASEKEL